MTASGLVEPSTAAIAPASRPSATAGSAPILQMSSALAGVRVRPTTEWPALINADTSGRPTAPVAPAMKIFMAGCSNFAITYPPVGCLELRQVRHEIKASKAADAGTAAEQDSRCRDPH